jgi:hypothetical protein
MKRAVGSPRVARFSMIAIAAGHAATTCTCLGGPGSDLNFVSSTMSKVWACRAAIIWALRIELVWKCGFFSMLRTEISNCEPCCAEGAFEAK